jgi:membrane-associated phospholipid phosphatase
MLMVPMLTLVDVAVSRWIASDPLPRELADIFDLCRVYSHGSGVFVILLGLILLAPKKRWYVPRLAALAMGGGAVATIVKMFVLRPRPSSLNLDYATYDHAWYWVFDWTLEHVATFDAASRAFPSGNVATAIALSVGLSVVLPRGKWLFIAICVGTILQRLSSGAHFVSDLFGGAGCGLVWAYVCFHPRLLGRVFDKMELESLPRRRDRNRDRRSAKESTVTTSRAA